MPRVSILICNHNYERYLRAAIESALGQSYPHTEVVVVDDGSTDASRELIASYSGRITAVLKNQGGMASAVNAGLGRCHGDWVAFLDSDDVFLQNKVEVMVELTRRAPGATLYYHRLRTIGADGHPQGRPWPRDLWNGDIRQKVRDAGGWWPRPTTSAMVVPRSFLNRIGPFPEGVSPGRVCWPDAYAGDLAPFLGEIRGIPDCLTHYRTHGRNASLTRPELRMHQGAFEVEQLTEALRRLGEPAEPLRLERHLGIARAAAATQPRFARLRAVWLALRCPALGAQGRILEALRLLSDGLRHAPGSTTRLP